MSYPGYELSPLKEKALAMAFIDEKIDQEKKEQAKVKTPRKGGRR